MKKSHLSGIPMRIQARPGSLAERYYFNESSLPGLAWPAPKAIAEGVSAAPLEDLIFHGGKTVPAMQFQNIYLGGQASWQESDISAIDSAILQAMRLEALNNVLVQYFPSAQLSCDARDSLTVAQPRPTVLDEPGVEAQITALYDSSAILRQDLGTTIFNLILPSGTELRLGDSSSTNGLGGYHGSVHIQRGGQDIVLYYSANVFSEILATGENGIVAFDRPWKNVVATLYHELNEFRTDADVNDAIAKRDNDFLGWASRQGHEIGDQPIFAANPLSLVFQEIANGAAPEIPVQFLYSNVVHGAEGPIEAPGI